MGPSNPSRSGRDRDAGRRRATVSPAEPRTRCWTCFKPEVVCVCSSVPRVQNRTRVTILQHPRERFHAIGTARLAHLGLANGALHVPLPGPDRSLAVDFEPPEGTGLLFPHPEAVGLETLERDARPTGLVVLDGTWSQARKLYQANPGLAQLPHYALSPTSPTRYRIRRAPRASYVSTIEAIVAALRILEPATPGLDGLLAAFDEMIDVQAGFAHRTPRRPIRKLLRQGRIGPGRIDSPRRR